MNKVIIAVIVIALVIYTTRAPEKYRPVGANYRYNMVDTNPERRVAGAFYTCSPENFGDCKFGNNPYEGLPLP